MTKNKIIILSGLLVIALCFGLFYGIKSYQTYKIKVERKKAIEKVNWFPYMTKLEKDVRKRMRFEKDIPQPKVVVDIEIAKDGTLVSSEVAISSHNKEADDFALSVLKKMSPFDPLPNEYTLDTIKFTLVLNDSPNF